jgi:outer membrane protein assembly factor BamB
MTGSDTQRNVKRWVLVGGVLLLALAGIVALFALHSPGNVSHPGLSFTVPKAATKAAPPVADTFQWPRYGFDAERTRDLPGSAALDPPFRRGWTYTGPSLIEFPPVIRPTAMFLVDDSGVAVAIDKSTGKVIWQRQIGTLAAASPALAQGLVVFALLSTNKNAGQNPGNGRFVALNQSTGRVAWSMRVPAGTESSPLVWGKNVYFGDQSGTVYALDVYSGKVRWTYRASGAVKGGPALWDGLLFFGDYAGRAYALNAATGRQVWAVSTSGEHFGFGSGNFYSTPAVAFGRVYMGNTDGRVYSFAARSGRLAWATGTGDYVYASASVADVPGLGPTVYVGSYDGRFYAFNAQSGQVRWSHAAGGKISGSSTIIGDVVYYSDLGSKTTTGLDVRTGRVMFSWPEGSFTPIVADRNDLFVVGYDDLVQLVPGRGAVQARAQAAARSAGRQVAATVRRNRSARTSKPGRGKQSPKA